MAFCVLLNSPSPKTKSHSIFLAAWNLLCGQGWPGSCRDLLASARISGVIHQTVLPISGVWSGDFVE